MTALEARLRRVQRQSLRAAGVPVEPAHRASGRARVFGAKDGGRHRVGVRVPHPYESHLYGDVRGCRECRDLDDLVVALGLKVDIHDAAAWQVRPRHAAAVGRDEGAL